jgi:hypothetical protein
MWENWTDEDRAAFELQYDQPIQLRFDFGREW